MDIEFVIDPELRGVCPEPLPASRIPPDWWRNMPPYPDPMPDQFPVPTVKRCAPFRDAMTLGYIIPLCWSVSVTADEEHNVNFTWQGDGPGEPLVGKHGIDQISLYPIETVPVDPFKFNNPWMVRTPPGWSTLFVPALNVGEQPFHLFAGVVDTDRYANTINFPFVWTRYPYQGVIEAGAPLVQAIPFKRETLTHLVRESTEDERSERRTQAQRIMAHVHEYSRNVRDPDRG